MEVASKQPQHGWIEVIAGSMFSGKSEELIRRLRRALCYSPADPGGTLVDQLRTENPAIAVSLTDLLSVLP